MEGIKSIIEIVTQIITIGGVPVAIYVYYKNKEKEIYNSLDDKYIDFLKLCIERPELKVSISQSDNDVKFTDSQQLQRELLYEMLISLLERAYLLYEKKSNEIMKAQARGWDAYMDEWMKIKSFRDSWKKLGFQYEESFVIAMGILYDKHKQTGASVP